MTIISPMTFPPSPGEVQPLTALLLYQVEQRIIGTLHPLTATRQGQAALGAGRPFSQRDVHDLLTVCAGQRPSATLQWLPAHLLAHGEDFLVWWRSGAIRPLWFAFNGQRFGFRVPWPSLVFVAYRKTLACAALVKNARPEPDTALCHAPLMNIDAQGRVCLGTAEIPTDHALERCAAWEAAVYATNFSHVNHRQTLQIKNESTISSERHFQFWQALEGQKRFPAKALAPMRRTLRGWLEEQLA
ncbi:MAG TPA: PRTRC system protein B [Candidatus Competibacteraceae bacterium]|nr:PRTRC system protein B [Candidatus Competibacteraceae bacterium]